MPNTTLDTPRGIGGKIDTNTGAVLSGPLRGTALTAPPAPTGSSPTVIPATTLTTPQTPYNIPENKAQSSTKSLAVANNATAASTKTDATLELPDANKAKDELSLLRQSLSDQIGGTAAAEDQARKEQDIYNKKSKATAVSNQLDQMDKAFRDEVKAIRENPEGKIGGAIEQDVAKAQDRYENNRANVALTYKVLAGDYNDALAIVNDKVASLQRQNAQAISLYELAADAVNNDLTESEKLIVQANLTKKQKEADTLQSAYATVLENAAKSGAPSSVLAAIDVASREPGATAAKIFAAAGSYSTDPLYKIQLATAQKQYSLLGQPTATERAAQTEALRNAETAIPLLQDKVNLIDTLKNHAGLASQVGPNPFARVPVTAEMTGAAQEFLGGVNQLISKETVDTLISLKARGGTLGALSNEERLMLQQAASKLGTWQIQEGPAKGKFNVSETAFKAELDTIKTLANRALINARGSLYTPEEEAAINEVGQDALTPDSYYNN